MIVILNQYSDLQFNNKAEKIAGHIISLLPNYSYQLNSWTVLGVVSYY